ncbi:translocation/assembly module TamB domain-containing protein [Cereibacter sphaeroides]|uniref:translocation/assembly module TamB domain-containing protein n=1 Tax=Cereibacter sphaeroides TaxID=1063 RepID=UPI001F1671D4|nr:translocation/assembly module TamB domain-containing protein [Cereibacter sphaeroides]MCE6961066.1 translocation/assembly module TamB domain-containing protein [Cereibacter sphaeroides]MCE6969636.1 translocation/assembly module TamB domain-containing protein [Cereibacter sphaeroides]MCE6975111.1 translocation/assembly module TamB domain-containing protein [Cereibacter sphaeroides]
MRIILFLLWLLLPVAAFAQSEAEDRGFLVGLIEDNLSSAGREVRIDGFRGALSSRATIERLTIADDQGIWLTLNKVVLDWSRSALLSGRLSVSELAAAEILLERLPAAAGGPEPPSPEAWDFALPELPVSVEIGRIAADRLVLGQPVLGSPVEATVEASGSLSGGAGQTQLQLRRTDGQQGELRLSASYSNITRELALDLDLTEAENGIASTLMGLPGTPPLELTVKGTGPITDYAADIRLLTEGQERLAGRVTVQGDTASGRQFAAQLGGDVVPMFLPQYASFFGPDVRLDVAGARAADGRLDLSRLLLSTQALQLQGNLVLAADGLPERIALQGRIASADGQPVLLPLNGPETRIGSADLDISYDAAQGEAWTARLRVADLDRPDLDARLFSLDGAGRIARTGTEAAATVEGTLDFAAQDLTPADPDLATALGSEISGRTRFSWVEGGDGLTLPDFTLDGSNYGLAANLTLDGLSSGLTVAGDASVRFDDLSRFSGLAGRPLGGRGTATVSGSTSLISGAIDAQATVTGTDLAVGLPEVDNLLKGESRVAISLLRDTQGTRLRDLRIEARTLTATASGTVATAGSDISARLDFSDLSVLGPRYRGRMEADARFTGTPDAGRVEVNAQGNDLQVGQPQVDGMLRGASTIDLAGRLENRALLLERATVNARTLRLSATGRLAGEDSDVTADLSFTDLAPLGSGFGGSLEAKAGFRGNAERATITADARARDLRVGQDQANSLLRGESTLSAQVRLENGMVQIDRAEMRNPQLAVSAQGSAGAAGRTVTLDARLANLGLIAPQFPGPLTLRGTVASGGEGYRIDLRAQGPGQIDLRAQGSAAANFSTLNLGVTGTAQAALADAFIAPRSVSGPVRFDLRVNGQPALSSVSGRITLSDGRLADPSLGLAIEALRGTVDLAGGRASVAIYGRPTGGGRLSVSGGIGLTSPFPADLSIDIGRAVLRDANLFETTASGLVTIRGPLSGGARIAGRIGLEETELRIPSTGFGGASGLTNLQHRNEPPAVHRTRVRAGMLEDGKDGNGGSTAQPYPLDLLISAPNRIFVRGRGLDAELGGELQLSGTTANVVPSGAFNLIRGRLDILGKRLVLSEAQLLLEGDFVPFLRVVASTESDGITTAVVIEGRADEPDVSFTSVPELPEEEVISRLLFGRGLDTISPLQAAQLASAVATLAGRGGEGVIGRLRQGFGLDDLDVSTSEDGSASLKAGKYISENVYTEVEVDQQGESEINLNLDVTPSITLRGSADNTGDTSIGVFFEGDY